MKNILNGELLFEFKRIFRIMKCTILFLFLFVNISFASKTYSQIMKVSIVGNNISTGQVIDEIESQTDYLFVYNTKDVDLSRVVSLDAKNETVADVLNQVFNGTNTTYALEGKNIRLMESAKPDNVVQNNRIEGVVRDADGMPVIGANVLIKGTSTGTITDTEGKFTLDVPANSVIVVSYIGFIDTEINVGTKKIFSIVLKEDSETLDEVVVVGYGTMKKKDVIGSVSSVKGDDLMKLNVSRADQALQGAAAGVMVSTSAGTAGAAPVIKVRGISSINLGTDPLWVVDGVVTGQSFMNNISPDDIESIEVLKDAAATAIYGSRASSGVVLVTTKSGKEKGSFSINYRLGISELNYNDVLCDREEYWQFYDTGTFNDSKGQTEYYDPQRDVISRFFKESNESLTREEALAENNDWVKILTRTAIRHDVSASMSQKGEKWMYYASFNFLQDEGVVRGDDMKRLAGSFKVQREIFKNFVLGASTNLSNNVRNHSYRFDFASRPVWVKPYGDKSINPSGYWNALVTNPHQNALLIADKKYNKNQTMTFDALTKAWAEYKIPYVEGLSLKSEVSMLYNSTRNLVWSSKEVDYLGKGSATDRNYNSEQYMLNLYATYNKTFGIHSFNIVGGYEYMKAKGYYCVLSGTSLGSDYDFMGVPGEVLEKNSYIGGENRFGSLFGRANYSLKERYMAGFSFRRDATYQFSPENRWANFVAGSLGWIISSEDFYSLDWMNMLKLRGSFGQTGNSNVPGDVRYNTFSYDPRGYGLSGGMDAYHPLTLGNDQIKWEKTTSVDFGFDFGFLNNRINGSIAYFNQNVSDLILKTPIPYSSGVTSILMNIGEMKNYGVELNLTSTNLDLSNTFKWMTNFNFTFNKNKVISLSPSLDNKGQGILSGVTITKVGESIGTYYVPEYVGVDTEKGIRMIREIDQEKFKEDGTTVFTGKIIPGTQTNKNNNKYIHSGKTGTPKWYGGITNNFSYKNFDFSILFTFAGGHYIYDSDLNGWKGDSEQAGNRIYKGIVENSWKKPGDVAEYPLISIKNLYPYDDSGTYSQQSLYNYSGTSSEFLYKGDYLRLKNLSIGYTLPKSITKKMGINDMRFYLSGTNLLTFTAYEGFDVELQSNNNLASGVRSGQVPTTRTFTLGVNLGF